MGQYYRVLTIENNKTKIYNRDLVKDNETKYTLAKLTEHSWWYNEFVNSVCYKIYDNSGIQIAWIGDYADDYINDLDTTIHNYSKELLLKIYKKCWDCVGRSIKYNKFLLNNRYLVNHDKLQYIDCNEYYVNNQNDDWCLHPLPLLTCIGNGYGGGDFKYPTEDTTTEFIGYWALDTISIQDEKPENYEEIKPIFKEK